MDYKELPEYKAFPDDFKKEADRMLDNLKKYGYMVAGDDRFKVIIEKDKELIYDCIECPEFLVGIPCDRCKRYEKERKSNEGMGGKQR